MYPLCITCFGNQDRMCCIQELKVLVMLIEEKIDCRQ
jgi:hypothetical protein